MPLIVKPNARRMQAFRDSPSERGHVRQSSITLAAPGKVRLFLAIGVVVIALVLTAAFLV
jgi:hypothetical protein